MKSLLTGLVLVTLLTVTGATQGPDSEAFGWFTWLDRPGALHIIWRTLVMGGQFWLVGTAAVIVAALVARRARSWRPLAVSVASVAALDVLIIVSKQLVGRTSPHSGLNEVLAGGTSYPSGHTANATMCLTLLAVLLSGPERRRKAVTIAVVGAVVVGLCNLILGYHWLSEVVASWLLGALIVLAAARFIGSDKDLSSPIPS
jgi:membrane-associated phospholipid phosphatase